MTNSLKEAGFSLLELLITIVMIMTLSIIGLIMVNHYSFKYNQVPKVKMSLTALHDAFNTCYFTQNNPNECTTLKNLEKLDYLNPDDIYNINVGYSPESDNGKFYKYSLSIINAARANDKAQLVINIDAPSKVHLQALNPTVSQLKAKKIKGRTYLINHYEWRYPALLPQYKNRQGNSLLPKLESNS